jgi:hypothetical protein
MPYTRAELENYQWYQDRVEARRDEYITYLQESQDEQEDNEIRQHMVDENGVLLSFENIDDKVRLQEPFRRAGLDTPDQHIIKTNQYTVFSKGQKFDITIDTEISNLTNSPRNIPTLTLANAPQENLLEPKLFLEPDSDGSITTPILRPPSRHDPRERTNGYTIDLVNGDIIAPSDWNNPSVNTQEDTIENYLQVYYLENNVRRQFPNFNIFNSYIGTLLSSNFEHEIILVEKEELDFIPLGTPMNYNTK